MFFQIISTGLARFHGFYVFECHLGGFFLACAYQPSINLNMPSAIPIDTTALSAVPPINGG